MKLIDKDKYFMEIFEYIKQNNLDEIRRLIEEFNHLNSHIKNASKVFFDAAFTDAIENEHFDIARYLVQKDQEDDPYPVSKALIKDIICRLVRSNYESIGRYYQKYTNPEDPTEKIKFFLEMGADINYMDSNYRTALDYAEEIWPKAEEALIKFGGKKGEDIKEFVINPRGLLQLDIYEAHLNQAVQAGNTNEVQRLIEEFDQLNSHAEHAADRFIKTAFIESVKKEHFEVARYLLQKAREYQMAEEAFSVEGSVLMVMLSLIGSGSASLLDDPTKKIQFLLEVGANINYPYPEAGETALDLVESLANWPKGVEALRKFGGKRHDELLKQHKD